MNKEVRDVLSGLNADHCLPADTRYDKRVEALRAAFAAIPKGVLHHKDDDSGAAAAPAA